MVKRNFAIKIEGIPKTVKRLTDTELKKIMKMDRAVHDAGFIMLGEVVMSARGQRAEPRSVDTGAYSTVGRGMQIDNSKFLESKIFNIMEYAQYLEKRRHHFENSMERNRERLIEFVELHSKII